MEACNVAVLGATGAVGREMLAQLEERNFPVKNLKLLSSAKSAGKKITFKGSEITVAEAAEDAFKGVDIVLGAAENDISKRFAPAIKASGAVYVDNSSAFRLDKDVPLVIPEINPGDIAMHKGIIANPNCSTIIALVAANPISSLSPIKAMVASTYQAVSGAGAGGITELEGQLSAFPKCETVSPSVFQYQIALNLIPQIGSFGENGYTSEEMKMQNEGRKILHLPEMKVSCTCVRVPVMRSHSISLTVITENEVSVKDACEAIAGAPGCRLYDDVSALKYPMPLLTSGQDLVYVGRIRKDLAFENAISLWCCGDQIRKGAATNAVQIAELLLK